MSALEYYATSLDHILAELERIDLLIQLQVGRARQLHATDENFQGLYIPEDEVDALLAAPSGLPHWATEPLPLAQAEVQTALDQLALKIAWRKTASKQRGIPLRLDQLAYRFQLDALDVDILLICLAPEIDLRYERLFGYLQDDVTKRRSTVDLVLNLLSASFEAKLAMRQRFAPTAVLFRSDLLKLLTEPNVLQPPLLGQYLKVDERVVNYLLDSNEIDERLQPYVEVGAATTAFADLQLGGELKEQLLTVAQRQLRPEHGLIFYFQGSYGVGKQHTAAALAKELAMPLLIVHGEALIGASGILFSTAVRLIAREAQLQNAVLYWSGFDRLLADEWYRERDELLHNLEQRAGLTILAGERIWEPVGVLYTLPFLRVVFPSLTYSERKQIWAQSLNGAMPTDSTLDLDALATKFRFTAGQIADATATAHNLARWRDPEYGQVTMSDLHNACRLQSNRKLSELAHKITPHYRRDDIVLPLDRVQQLREVVNQVKCRARVYDEWGFDRKLALGKGINILFAGPSGTGKTMAADIMAGELGLDLYKIDLATVVSKYIGETEKNLARIFQEAETSNAILFFDEADALFGKRSEVRDAHDRYANIEISYLLQRMEEYEGVVILATNLRNNMDDAFVRRLHFIVEFPFPNESHRQHIWEKIWPDETPRGTDLDLGLLARRLEISGGNIRNIALAAAFMAAGDGGVVNMEHLVRATRREYQKMGKVVLDGEFGVKKEK